MEIVVRALVGARPAAGGLRALTLATLFAAASGYLVMLIAGRALGHHREVGIAGRHRLPEGHHQLARRHETVREGPAPERDALSRDGRLVHLVDHVEDEPAAGTHGRMPDLPEPLVPAVHQG